MPTCLLRTVVPNDKNWPEIDSLQFAWCDFTNFFNSIFITSVSDDCSLFIFKICQTVAVNFTGAFFNLIFGGIFAIWPNCTTPRAFEPFSGSQLGFCRPLDEFYCYSVLRPKPSPKIGSLDKALLFWYWQQLNKFFLFWIFFSI